MGSGAYLVTEQPQVSYHPYLLFNVEILCCFNGPLLISHCKPEVMLCYWQGHIPNVDHGHLHSVGIENQSFAVKRWRCPWPPLHRLILPRWLHCQRTASYIWQVLGVDNCAFTFKFVQNKWMYTYTHWPQLEMIVLAQDLLTKLCHSEHAICDYFYIWEKKKEIILIVCACSLQC